MIIILHDDWSVRFGENKPVQSSQIFGGYASVQLSNNLTSSFLTISYHTIL